MKVNDYGKMIVLIVLTAGLIVLRATGSLSETEFGILIGSILGYIIGNGRNAIAGDPPSPVITSSTHSAPIVIPNDAESIRLERNEPRPLPGVKPGKGAGRRKS